MKNANGKAALQTSIPGYNLKQLGALKTPESHVPATGIDFLKYLFHVVF